MTRNLAYPQTLWLLFVLIALASLAVVAWLSRRRKWRLLGRSAALAVLSSRLPGRRWIRVALVALGLCLAGLGMAGPQWGREKAEVTSAARDLVVVLDVSRSMLAEMPSRQLRAQRLLADLAKTLSTRGGHRVALVISAAKAQLVVPLTTDYELFAAAVFEQDAGRLMPELRPGKEGPVSGTRLGEGLQQAVAAHDPKYHGSQVILLVSDGDDPANDGEWKDGATAARKLGIPVYTVGVGDPDRPSKIRLGEHILTHSGKPVETVLHEDVLKEIARRTDGVYFPVRTDNAVPGTLFQAVLEASAARPRETPPLENPRPRYRWFFGPAALLLFASLFVRERGGTRPSIRVPELAGHLPLFGRPPRAVTAVALGFAALLLVGAGMDTEDMLRQGNDAFQKKDYEAALKFYEQGEERCADPGQVAFNKGAALSRLGRWREAELCFLRSLQDREAPSARRLKALFALGSVLIQRGALSKDADALSRAVDCYELCRGETSDAAIRDDAEHNAELARLLWLKVRAEAPNPAGDNPEPEQGPDPGRKPFDKSSPLSGEDPSRDPGDGKMDPARQGESKGQDSDKKMPGAGNIKVSDDSDQLEPLDGQDARDVLSRAIQRIQHDPTRESPPAPPENRGIQDW
jgi:Mg-chelatase subunit ChlD